MDKRHHVVEPSASSGVHAGSEASKESQQKLVKEGRAAELLGVTAEKLRQLSSETGLGHAEYEQGHEQVVFTYAELYRLCRSAAQAGD
jgi:hypothetical protein